MFLAHLELKVYVAYLLPTVHFQKLHRYHKIVSTNIVYYIAYIM